ncbi:MSCRAMM family protein [Polyangium spumosum]|nr:SdrD B-like domain-containing protein [Polyangium spumosum]
MRRSSHFALVFTALVLGCSSGHVEVETTDVVRQAIDGAPDVAAIEIPASDAYKTCAELQTIYDPKYNPAVGATWSELEIPDAKSGTYSDGTLEVALSIYGGVSLSWASQTLGVRAAIVKSPWHGASLYVYDPESWEDDYLSAPLDKYIEYVSFCYDQTATAAGVKFHDLNANGMREANEPGLAGWTIYVDKDKSGTLSAGDLSAVTDANGEYKIENIPPGYWGVLEDLQTGWTCSHPASGSYMKTFSAKQAVYGLDFGNWTRGSKSGTKYLADAYGMCTYDAVSGIDIYLFSDVNKNGMLDAGDVKLDKMATGNDGSYLFSNLEPGDYLVCEAKTAEYEGAWPKNDVCSSEYDDAYKGQFEKGGYTFTITSGKNETNNDFCNKPVEEEEEFQGCTPGYWKNHLDSWEVYLPGQKLGTVFIVPSSLSPLGGSTLIQALNFGGGSGLQGAARILLRAAVAALLNAAHSGVDYEFSTTEIITAVNVALAGSRNDMIELAELLDAANNAGECPLN